MPCVSSFCFSSFVTLNALFAIVNAQIAELNAQLHLWKRSKKSPVILNAQYLNLFPWIVRLNFQLSTGSLKHKVIVMQSINKINSTSIQVKSRSGNVLQLFLFAEKRLEFSLVRTRYKKQKFAPHFFCPNFGQKNMKPVKASLHGTQCRFMHRRCASYGEAVLHKPPFQMKQLPSSFHYAAASHFIPLWSIVPFHSTIWSIFTSFRYDEKMKKWEFAACNTYLALLYKQLKGITHYGKVFK